MNMNWLADQAQEVLSKLLDIVSNGLDVAPSYVLDLMHRYWVYYAVANWVWLVISLAIAIVLRHFWFKWIKEDEEYGVACFLFSIFTLVPIVFCAIDMVKAIFLPDLVFINYLK